MSYNSNDSGPVFKHNPKTSLLEAYNHIIETANYEHFEGFEESYEEIFEEILHTLDQDYDFLDKNGTLSWSNGRESLKLIPEENDFSDSFNTLHYRKDYEDTERHFSSTKSLNFREGKKPRELIE